MAGRVRRFVDRACMSEPPFGGVGEGGDRGQQAYLFAAVADLVGVVCRTPAIVAPHSCPASSITPPTNTHQIRLNIEQRSLIARFSKLLRSSNRGRWAN